MVSHWTLSNAKNRLSEVIRRALSGEPQRIRRRGEEVVVLDARTFDRLRGADLDFISFLTQAPDLSGLDLERDRSTPHAPDL